MSGLLHFGLIVLLQMLLVQKGGLPLIPDGFAPPSLSVSIRHLSAKPLAIPGPKVKRASEPEPASASSPPLPPPLTDPPDYGLEVFEPPAYLPVEELSEKPQIIKDIPAITADLMGPNTEGAVVMRLQINDRGTVDDVVIEETSIAVADLQILTNLFRRTVFSPGLKDGNAVNSELRIQIVIEKPSARQVFKTRPR